MKATEAKKLMDEGLTKRDKRELRSVLRRIKRSAKGGYKNQWFSHIRPRVIYGLEDLGYSFKRVKKTKNNPAADEITWS